jgi:hypothetical protein
MTLRLREVTDDERAAVQRIARSHTLGAAFVRRAQIVVHAVGGLKAEQIATRMDLCGNTVRYWLNCFNARGCGCSSGYLIDLADAPLRPNNLNYRESSYLWPLALRS